MTWPEFVAFALSPAGIGIIIGVILSFAIEYVPQYMALESKYKRLVYLGLAFAIPLALTAINIATTGAAWTDWEGAWWPALGAGFAAFTGGTVIHTRKLNRPDV